MDQLEIFMIKIVFFQKDVPWKALESRRLRKKIEDTEYFMPCKYEQKYTIKKEESYKMGHGPT